LPRLNCKFSEFIEIICLHGFVMTRHEGGSHRTYRGVIDGEVKFVTVAPHQMSDTIKRGTLKALIRDCGLPAKLFRK
jgi:predicted RNA binding protein YcfA (HicA-like mRNA interferase family)